MLEGDLVACKGEHERQCAVHGRGRLNRDGEFDHAVALAHLPGHGNACDRVVGGDGDVEGGAQAPSRRQGARRKHGNANGLVGFGIVVSNGGESERARRRIPCKGETCFRQARIRAGDGEVHRDAPVRQRGGGVRRCGEHGGALLFNAAPVGAEGDGVFVGRDGHGVRRPLSNCKPSGQGGGGVRRKRDADVLLRFGAVAAVRGDCEFNFVRVGRNGENAAGAAVAAFGFRNISRTGDGNILPVRFRHGKRNLDLPGVRRSDLDAERYAPSFKHMRGGSFECNGTLVGRNGETERALPGINAPTGRMPARNETQRHAQVFGNGKIPRRRLKGDQNRPGVARNVNDIAAPGPQEGSNTPRGDRILDANPVVKGGACKVQLDGRSGGGRLVDGDNHAELPARLKHGASGAFLQTKQVVVGRNGNGVAGVLADDPSGRKPVCCLRVASIQGKNNLRLKLGPVVRGYADIKTERARNRHGCSRNWKGDGGTGNAAADERRAVVRGVAFIVQRAFELKRECNAFGRHVTPDREGHGVVAALRNLRALQCEPYAVGLGHPRVEEGDCTAGHSGGQIPPRRQRGCRKSKSEGFADCILVPRGGDAERRRAFAARNGERLGISVPPCREDPRNLVITRIGCRCARNHALAQR